MRHVATRAVLSLALCGLASQSLAQDIHEAARAGDLATVSALLVQDARLVDARDERDCTPLHYAAGSGSTELAELLIERGATVDARNHEGQTPLLWAALTGHRDVADLLIRQGADLESREDYGRTPLLLVARETGNVEMGSLLITAGADVNARDRFDATPLNLSAWRGYRGMVDLLLDNGAEVPTDPEGMPTYTRFAVEKGLTRLFEILVDAGADLGIRSENGGSLLHSASAGGSAEIVGILLREGLAPDEQDRYGRTPLHYAAEKNRTAVLALLIDAGADLDLRSLAGNTPLNSARANSRVAAVQVLEARGADPSPPAFPELAGPYFGQMPPGNEPLLFAPDIVSSHRFEHGTIAFSPDGREAFWSSSFEPADSGYTWSIIMTSAIEDGRWTPPRPAQFSGEIGSADDVPFFAPDGQRLYFDSARPDRPGGSERERIWYVDRIGDGWSQPTVIEGGPNSKSMHWQFSVAANGNIYFSSGDPGGFGMGDIYVSRFVDGRYLEPENLGEVVNSEDGESSPFIAPDESYMLFVSVGRSGGLGRVDLYATFKDAAGNWTPPINMGVPVNSRSNEICPIVTLDGEYLFFNSFRNGNADNYWIDSSIIEELRGRGGQD